MNIQPRIGHAERTDFERGHAPQERKGRTNAVIHAARDAARRLADRVGISPRAKATAMIGSGLSLLGASLSLVSVAGTETPHSGTWVMVFGSVTMAGCAIPVLAKGLEWCKSEARQDAVDSREGSNGVPGESADDRRSIPLDVPEQERSATGDGNPSASKYEA